MAISEVTDTDVFQHCDACGDERRVLLDALTVGVAHEDRADGRVVPMPPCPVCGATEFLVRVPDNEPEHPSPGSFGHRHRMLVDHLHAELVGQDKVVAPLLDQEGHAPASLARPLTTEAKDRWFARGMKIDAPVREQPAAPREEEVER
jgi:hypothetical protein